MIDNLRKRLDKLIDTSHLTDIEVLKIYEEEAKKRDSILMGVNGYLNK